MATAPSNSTLGTSAPLSSSDTDYSPTSHEHVQARLKRRRLNGSSSDDDQQTWVPVDAWLAHRETHYGAYPERAEFPRNETVIQPEGSVAAVVNEHNIGSFVQSLVQQNRLTFRSAGFCNRTVRRLGQRACYAITISGPLVNLDRIAQAVHEHISSFRQDGTSRAGEFLVEVYDAAQISDFGVFVIPPKHPQSAVLVKLRDEVFDAARSRIKQALVGVGIYQMHAEETGTSYPLIPTIGVMVAKDRDANFDALSIQLMGIIAKEEAAHMGFKAQMRILESSPLEQRSVIDVEAPPKLGSSIGVEKTTTAGTLGGYLYFTPPDGRRREVFMTCAHVVVVEDTPRANKIRRMALSLDHGPPDILIKYPSCGEITDTRSSLDSTLKEAEEELKDAQEKIEMGWTTKKSIRFVAEKPAEIADAKSKLARLEKLEAAEPIGRVLAMSPIEPSEKHRRMDWALVELTQPGVFGPNEPPKLVGSLDSRMPRPPGEVYKPGHVVEDIVQVEPGMWVAMTGRTTSFAAGIVNGELTKYTWHIPTDAGTQDHITYEWEVGKKNDPRSLDFGTGGDSGAWVCNKDGELVGLYWGGEGWKGLLTPMTEVVEDVHARTNGGVLELPQ